MLLTPVPSCYWHRYGFLFKSIFSWFWYDILVWRMFFFIETWTFWVVCNGTVALIYIFCFSRRPWPARQWWKVWTMSLLCNQGRSSGSPLGRCWHSGSERLLVTALWKWASRLDFLWYHQGCKGQGHLLSAPHVSAWPGWQSRFHTWPCRTSPWWWGEVLCNSKIQGEI